MSEHLHPQHLPQAIVPPQRSSGMPLARDGSPSGAGDSRSARGPLRAPRCAHLGCHSEEGLFFCRLLPRNLLHHHGHSLIGRPSAFALQQRNQQWRQVSSGLRPPPAHALPTRPGGTPAAPAPGSEARFGSRTRTRCLKIIQIIIRQQMVCQPHSQGGSWGLAVVWWLVRVAAMKSTGMRPFSC